MRDRAVSKASKSILISSWHSKKHLLFYIHEHEYREASMSGAHKKLNYSERVQIVMTPEENADFIAIAKSRGIDRSKLLRQLIRDLKKADTEIAAG